MKAIRKARGSNLVELLIVVVVMGILASATFGILTATMTAQHKLDNKCDSIDSSKKAIDQITRIVRMGRVIGSASDNNSLIVQLPKFSDAGFPYKDAVTGADAVETHLFNVLPDPDNSGEYFLQWRKNPGATVPLGSNPNINTSQGPVIVLKGIIGPLGISGALQVFQYVDKNNPSVPQNSPTGAAADYTGVIINLETLKHGASASTGGGYQKSVSFACKTEVFLRNNSGLSQ